LSELVPEHRAVRRADQSGGSGELHKRGPEKNAFKLRPTAAGPCRSQSSASGEDLGGLRLLAIVADSDARRGCAVALNDQFGEAVGLGGLQTGASRGV